MKISSGFLPTVSNKYEKRLIEDFEAKNSHANQSQIRVLDIMFAEHEKSPICCKKTEAALQRKEERDMVLLEKDRKKSQ